MLHDSASRRSALLSVRTTGGVSAAEEQAAAAMIGEVLRGHPSAYAARLRVTAGPGYTLVQVNLRVGPTDARIQVAGTAVQSTIVMGADRLRSQIERITAGGGAWSSPFRPFAGQHTGAVIARLKSCEPRTLTAPQAAAALADLDLHIHLYADSATGADTVVFRVGSDLRVASSAGPSSASAGVPAGEDEVPTLTAAQATVRLKNAQSPFLFYTDAATGRGNVLYQRYDRQLGLLAPVPRTTVAGGDAT
ncbi:MAG: hypothetical protein HOV83_06120 [Catenulispora sp.]|nr:hypothetical protein [Catenulispora sp.]